MFNNPRTYHKKTELQRYTFYEFIKNLFLIVKTGNYLIVRILVKYVIAHPHDDTSKSQVFEEWHGEKNPLIYLVKEIKYKITYTLWY